MIITVVLGIICLVTSTGLYVSVKKNLELLERLEDVEDAADNALKVLDEHHQKIGKKSRIEVFSDEPIVRDLVQDIVAVKHAVHEVALRLDESLSTQTQDEDSEMSKS